MVPLLLLLLAVLAATVVASALFINWVQYIRPATKDNDARGVCLFKDYLAVVGEANEHYFVALLDKATGKVVKTWKGEDGYFLNCLSIGDRLYAVGKPYLADEGGIYMFDEELNVLKRVKTDWAPLSLSSDGDYLYFAGYARRGLNGDGSYEYVWRIEKTTLDLSVVASREVYKEFIIYKKWERRRKSAYLSLGASDIAVNPVTGDLWAVGAVGGGELYSRTSDYYLRYFLLVIFDRELNVKTVVEEEQKYLIRPRGICFDERGDAHAVGWDGVVKFDKSGKVLAVNRRAGGDKIACVGGRVYVFGSRYRDNLVGNDKYYVLYVLDGNLNLLDELILNAGVRADSDFRTGRPAFDGRNLYVAGEDKALGRNNSRIVVYSISVPTARVDV